jgi:hypothetical protein
MARHAPTQYTKPYRVKYKDAKHRVSTEYLSSPKKKFAIHKPIVIFAKIVRTGGEVPPRPFLKLLKKTGCYETN